MKPRSFFAFLAASAIVLLSLGASGLYWLMANSPAAPAFMGATNPAAAMFVPSDAPAMVSLLVNPERLEAFGQLVAPPQQRRHSQEEFNQFKQSLLAGTDINYQQDIQPWLGDEITLACTTSDIDRNPGNGMQPGYLLALSTKNASRSREFLDLFWNSKAIAGTDLVFEPYQGATLIYKNNLDFSNANQTDLLSSTASAVVGDRFVLFANNPKVLRDAINNIQAANLNLTSSTSYQLALGRLTQRRIGLTFVNLPEMAVAIADRPTPTPDNSALIPTSEAPDKSQQLVIALQVNQQGLLAQTALIVGTDAERGSASPTLSGPVEALQYIPAGSMLAIGGRDLQQFWTEVAANLGGEDFVAELANQSITSIGDRLGISLPQDIFPWVQGEYALGLVPSLGRAVADGESNLDWIFVAQTSAEADEAIDHLDAIALQQGLSGGPLMLGDREIYAWTKLSTADAADSAFSPMMLKTQVQGLRATVGNYEIFTSSLEAMDRAIAASVTGGLVLEANFKGAIAVLPQPNYGYVYFDWKASETILERRLPLVRLVEVLGRPILKHLRAIAISSAGGDASLRRADVFVQLGM